ncbi:MAG TPA: hypothetical protein VHL57_00465, partial [Flavobacteriales bacterium]|nr:hypothetical protein [Flavobacteriales bacterium]
MTRPEKRYYKLYTSRHLLGGHSNYHLLFDAIAAMDVYDEAALRKKFEGEAFLRSFSITKRRLYESILQSLNAFHADSSLDAKLRRQLHQVELLYQRALYQDAEKILRSVRTQARTHERHGLLLEVADWQRRLMERTNYQDVDSGDLEEMRAQAAGVLQQWGEMDTLWHLKSRSFLLLYRGGQARDRASEGELRAMLDHALLAEGVQLGSRKARFLHHHVRSAIAFALGELAECERHLEINGTMLRTEQEHFIDEPNLLLSVMSNHTYVRMRLGQYDAAIAGLKEFRRLPLMLPDAPSPDLEMKVFAMGASLELTVLNRMGAFDQAVEKLNDIEDGLTRFSDQLSVIRKAGICFQAAYACFGAERYDKALRWCNRLLNESGIDAHEELHAMARLLDLMVLLELGKHDLLPYSLRNTERFLRARGRDSGLERALLTYAHARMKAGGRAALQQAHTHLHEALCAVKAAGKEPAAFDHFDPLAWAESKVSGR